ncbi:Hsp70 nucleotide exchange factor fes1 [Hondaea fermentalgiana]|uniref:Hsp70 nucleotide exchange factor fes1 n=1 Tax=Hondaea fermentalgiana TaxID=2315210 RepID=A0A2R5GIQ0_9STRA|nr:Hsp70 nucleotide exchange factor fes1 [Hondaea fermentalgiana]|eukprot:GBG30189.1 Hsp70 nucleotide exchange factor fes1 [Hondaea fermentalgiana]
MSSANLQQWTGLLQWSLQYQDGTQNSDVGAMDPERRAFLKNALENHITDPAEGFKALIAVLQTPRAEGGNDEATEEEFVERKVEALEAIMGYVEQIDWARDFVKLGGFKIVTDMTQDEHKDIRIAALEVFGACVQNNPPVQEAAMELKALPILMDKLRSSGLSATEYAKVLFAVATFIRECTPASIAFIKDEKGVALLLDIIKANEAVYGIRAQRKALFLMHYIITTVPAVRIALGGQLIAALNVTMLSQDIDLRENSMKLLLIMYADAHVRERLEDEILEQTRAALSKFSKTGDHFEDLDETALAMAAELREAIDRRSPPSTEEPALLANVAAN